MKLTYQQWEKLTPEEQNKVPESELPEIPKSELENKLILSRMILKDGERYWEIQSEGEETTMIYPEYRQKKVSNQEIWYKFNPMWGYYSMNLTGMEPSMEEEPIGSYGMKWLNWMKANHPHLVGEMQMNHNLLTVARAVDEKAWEYRELLDNQYLQTHPRPKILGAASAYEQMVEWERTRTFYTYGAVMKAKVLVAVTQP